MLFGIIQTNSRNSAKGAVTVKVKLYDDSVITTQLEDTELVFKTGLGVSKIALKDIKRMENTNKAITTRPLLETNRFVIYYRNGSRIVGVPQSSGKIHLNGLNTTYARGDIKLWEIDWLEVECNHQDER